MSVFLRCKGVKSNGEMDYSLVRAVCIGKQTAAEAKALGINLLDAGHYSTETVVCPVLKNWLEIGFPDISVIISQTQREVFAYL